MVLLLGEFFGAIKEISKKVPDFSENRKKEISKETEKLLELEEKFNNEALSFGIGSRSDEILAIADSVNKQSEKLKNLYVIYAKELES